MDQESAKRILEFINMTDEEFFDTFVAEGNEEEQEAFLKEFPEMRVVLEKNK